MNTQVFYTIMLSCLSSPFSPHSGPTHGQGERYSNVLPHLLFIFPHPVHPQPNAPFKSTQVLSPPPPGLRDISLLLAHHLFSLLLVRGLWLPLWEPFLPHPKPTWLECCFSFTSFKAPVWPGLANESSTISQGTVIGQGPGMGPDYRKMRLEVGEGHVLWILGNQSFLSLLQKLEEETLTLFADRGVSGGDGWKCCSNSTATHEEGRWEPLWAQFQHCEQQR